MNLQLQQAATLPPSLQPIFAEEPQAEEELAERAEQEGIDLPHFYYLLEQLKRQGMLTYHTPLISCSHLKEHKTIEQSPYRLSRFAIVRCADNAMVVETPFDAATITLKSAEALELLYRFQQPTRPGDLADSDTIALLISAQVLTCDPESVPLQQWEVHDLYFHSRSRLGRQIEPYGGTYRFEGEISPLPALKRLARGEPIPLTPPKTALDLPLSTLFEQRQSIREQGTAPITLQQLSDFLHHAARVKRIDESDGQEYAFRYYPGGGARYELEIYPVVHRCESLASAIYHYHPGEHALYRVADLDAQAELLLSDAVGASGAPQLPQVLLCITARFQRVSFKYQSVAYAVILKNLGVLYQTFYLTATAMNLAPCALGGGNSDLFAKVANLPYLEETTVGEFMLGSHNAPFVDRITGNAYKK